MKQWLWLERTENTSFRRPPGSIKNYAYKNFRNLSLCIYVNIHTYSKDRVSLCSSGRYGACYIDHPDFNSEIRIPWGTPASRTRGMHVHIQPQQTLHILYRSITLKLKSPLKTMIVLPPALTSNTGSFSIESSRFFYSIKNVISSYNLQN